jgi:uncharacterized RDD family membrane protein YckC
MALLKIDTAFNIDLEFEIAEFHKRLFAYAIDFCILIFYAMAMKYLLHGSLDYNNAEIIENRLESTRMAIDTLAISIPMLLYSFLTELWMNGQTVGKKLMNIRVISLDGGEPTFGQYLYRWIVKFFEWPFLFGYVIINPLSIIAYAFITAMFGIVVVIVIAITKNSQRLGDIIAGTVVVNTKTNLGLDDTIFMQVNQTNYIVSFPEVMRLSDRDINTIKGVLTQAGKRNNFDMCNRVAGKVQDVLKIKTEMYADQFLEKLLEDYNYLATRE